MVENELPKKIKELRESKKLTQIQLGKALGVSNKTISKWEKGIFLPDIIYLLDLAKFFDISVDELLGKEKSVNLVKLSKLNKYITIVVFSLTSLFISHYIIVDYFINTIAWEPLDLMIVGILYIWLFVSLYFACKYIDKIKCR